MKVGHTVTLDRTALDRLIDVLRTGGYTVVGPTLRDGAVVYDEVTAVSDLPEGWTDEQEGGRYRVKRRDDGALFGYTVGPHSWKKYVHAPVVTLFRARRSPDAFVVEDAGPKPERVALLGVRACELAALAIQDRVFLGGPYVDTHYKTRREGLFVVAVNCGQAGATCFCASMKTGPRAKSGFDLALTEVLGDPHRFVVEVGTERGAEVAAALPVSETSQRDKAAPEEAEAKALTQMGRTLDATGVKELLMSSYENPRWDAVALRCLACANCTMVCPTCFCTTVEDVSDLAGTEASRVRRWDSCFTMDFSYLHGGSLRTSGGARYRQWITHKLATWHDQFGTSGCVGCGRCITWCPVGIDITEEVRALAATKTADRVR